MNQFCDISQMVKKHRTKRNCATAVKKLAKQKEAEKKEE